MDHDDESLRSPLKLHFVGQEYFTLIGESVTAGCGGDVVAFPLTSLMGWFGDDSWDLGFAPATFRSYGSGGGAVRWGGHQTFTHLNLPMYTYVGFLQLGGGRLTAMLVMVWERYVSVGSIQLAR